MAQLSSAQTASAIAASAEQSSSATEPSANPTASRKRVASQAGLDAHDDEGDYAHDAKRQASASRTTQSETRARAVVWRHALEELFPPTRKLDGTFLRELYAPLIPSGETVVSKPIRSVVSTFLAQRGYATRSPSFKERFSDSGADWKRDHRQHVVQRQSKDSSTTCSSSANGVERRRSKLLLMPRISERNLSTALTGAIAAPAFSSLVQSPSSSSAAAAAAPSLVSRTSDAKDQGVRSDTLLQHESASSAASSSASSSSISCVVPESTSSSPAVAVTISGSSGACAVCSNDLVGVSHSACKNPSSLEALAAYAAQVKVQPTCATCAQTDVVLSLTSGRCLRCVERGEREDVLRRLLGLSEWSIATQGALRAAVRYFWRGTGTAASRLAQLRRYGTEGVLANCLAECGHRVWLLANFFGRQDRAQLLSFPAESWPELALL